MCLRCSTKPSLTHGMKTSRKEMNTFRSILTFHYEHCEEYYSLSQSYFQPSFGFTAQQHSSLLINLN